MLCGMIEHLRFLFDILSINSDAKMFTNICFFIRIKNFFPTQKLRSHWESNPRPFTWQAMWISLHYTIRCLFKIIKCLAFDLKSSQRLKFYNIWYGVNSLRLEGLQVEQKLLFLSQNRSYFFIKKNLVIFMKYHDYALYT